MREPNQSSRRQFLAASAATTTVLAAGLSLSRSVHAAGSERFNVILVGAGLFRRHMDTYRDVLTFHRALIGCGARGANQGGGISKRILGTDATNDQGRTPEPADVLRQWVEDMNNHFGTPAWAKEAKR